ncbi:MAG: hypothetical protein VXA14_06515 [Euryarchaeota archaeon]
MVFKTLLAMLVSGYVSFGVSMMATGGFPQSDLMTITLSFSVVFLMSFSMISIALAPKSKRLFA